MKYETEWKVHHPLPTTNGLNTMHRFARVRHTKQVREEAKLMTLSWINLLAARHKVSTKACKITITLTRYGRSCDKEENLPGAFKALKDGIADAFHHDWQSLNAKGYGDDSDKRFKWEYAQRGRKKTDPHGLVKIAVETP